MLDKLSTEILVLIFSELTERRDLASVCQVSKRLHSVASSVLFRSIALKAKDLALERVAVEGIIATHRQTGALHYTKNIHVSSPFHGRLEKRCLHHNTSSACGDDEDGLNDDDDLEESEHQDKKTWIENDDAAFGRDDFCRFKDRLMAVLIRCREGMLENFTWQLGTCVPEEILGKNGYLPLKQKNLKSLRLITDASCEWNGYNLTPFTKLTSLSWHGFRPDIDFISIWKCFSVCSHQLTCLDLDFYSLAIDPDRNFLVQDDGGSNLRAILRPLSGERQPFFPDLQELSLASIPLPSEANELVSAFGFQSLRSLKLRFCPGWEELLAHLTSLKRPIYLETLEIQSANYFAEELESTIPDFLNVVKGLKEIFISTRYTGSVVLIWHAIFQHHLTFKNFVHHSRSFGDIRAEPHDIQNDSLDIFTYLAEFLGINQFGNLDLGCVGFCCFDKLFRPNTNLSYQKITVRVLHIRASGQDMKPFKKWAHDEGVGWRTPEDCYTDDSDYEELVAQSINPTKKSITEPICANNKKVTETVYSDDPEIAKRIYPGAASDSLKALAQWVFGERGLPSLQLLAYGDFSYNGRYSSANVLFCRQQGSHAAGGKTYRHATKDDSFALDLLRQYSHVLQACPSDRM
ncbi:hypothetical protein MaudCBS49596_006190 [Microsporum audouinii]